MITIFKNYSDTRNPKFFEIDTVLESIKKCNIQKQVDEIRREQDEKIKKELKKQLPCILFSGEFSYRSDKSILRHSGYVVLDWDGVLDVESKKREIMQYNYVYACFTSPSGDGLKAVVKIPPIIEKHRGYYRGLVKVFPELDSTSINESRICYASCDKDIYINKEAIEFTDYIEEHIKPLNPKSPLLGDLPEYKGFNDYSKANIALKMIRDSIDGEKHISLLKASRLMGGYISGGIIEENEAIRLLENEIKNKNVDDFEAAQITIKKGIEHGKSDPIIKEEKKFSKTEIKKTQEITEEENVDFFANINDIDSYLGLWKNGGFQKGLTTGLSSFDKYFLFKKGNFNVINGFDNVGKSTGLWYLCMLSSMNHGWKWLIYSNENRPGTVVKKLIEFYWGETVVKMGDLKYKKAYSFVMDHFKIISNDFLFTYKDILSIADKALENERFDGILIDPYNSLSLDYSRLNKISTHEYHYEAASEMQLYAKKNDICVYLNCHVITSALREGTAPKKADTEGGGKFSNKADDFMTFHRETQNPETWRQMQIHVRKIKELETGGGYTPKDSPFILEMNNNGCGYSDTQGNDAVQLFHKNKNESSQQNVDFSGISPNTSFENEAPKHFHEPTNEPPSYTIELDCPF